MTEVDQDTFLGFSYHHSKQSETYGCAQIGKPARG